MYPACWSVAEIYPPLEDPVIGAPLVVYYRTGVKRCCLYLTGMRPPYLMEIHVKVT